MNRFNFQQTGGFPLTTDIFNNIQTAYSIFNQFVNILSEDADKKIIISGCRQDENNVVSSGYVCVWNEILPFKGGVLQPYVYIKETEIKRVFEDGSLKKVDIIREVVFGNDGDYNMEWSDFKRISSLQEQSNILKTITDLDLSEVLDELHNEIEALRNQLNGMDDHIADIAAGVVDNKMDDITEYVFDKGRPNVAIESYLENNGNFLFELVTESDNMSNYIMNVIENNIDYIIGKVEESAFVQDIINRIIALENLYHG